MCPFRTSTCVALRASQTIDLAVLAGADEPAAGRVEGDVVDGAAVAAGDRAERAVVEVEQPHRAVLAADRRDAPVLRRRVSGGQRPDRPPGRLREAPQHGERRGVADGDAVRPRRRRPRGRRRS